MRPLALLLLLALPLPALEPLPEDRGETGLQFLLRKIESGVRVMYIVSHPDDEDAGTLTYLSRGLGADVTLVSITRGEGGANQVSNDFFDRLGALRTLELQAAAQYYAARTRFTTFTDYGYSKTMEEALRNWDENALIGELVQLIREEKPHIVMNRWRGDPRDGHGQHQATGRVGYLAFQAAADPARYPGLAPWKPLQYYAGNYREGDPDENLVAIDSGIYEPLLGMTYAQFGRRGLSKQRSQGAGSAILDGGPAVRYYQRRDDAPSEYFEDDYDALQASLGWDGGIDPRLDFRPTTYRGWGCTLFMAAANPAQNWRDDVARRRLRQTLAAHLPGLLGIEFKALVQPANPPTGPFSAFMPYETAAYATAGQPLNIQLAVAQGEIPITPATEAEHCDVSAVDLEVIPPEGWEIESLGEGRFRATPSAQIPPSTAPWSRDSDFAPRYEMRPGSGLGQLDPPPLKARAKLQMAEFEWLIEQPVESSYLDELGVQRRRPLAVAPAVSIALPTAGGFLPTGQMSYALTATVTNHRAAAVEVTIRPKLPPGWSSQPPEQTLSFQREAEALQVSFELRAPSNVAPGAHPVQLIATWQGGESAASFQRITFSGLDSIHLAKPADHMIQVVDAKLPSGLEIGYVMGTGDDVPEAIRQLGAAVTLLDEQALESTDLSAFHTVVLGIRAYANRDDLIRNNSRLLSYVESGGVLVVQYNTPEFDNDYGPFPYKMGRRPEETAEQDSPVQILAPEHPLLTWPNRITTNDFDGWVEQRGSKFLAQWDERYTPLIETHDRGQSPQEGIWLAARHGKGLYVYCALAWYRQLPYAVPGAARIFANLLAQGHAEAPWRQR